MESLYFAYYKWIGIGASHCDRGREFLKNHFPEWLKRMVAGRLSNRYIYSNCEKLNMDMEFWKNVGGSLPDWVASVAFIGLALIMFVSFVTTDNNSPVFKLLMLVAGATGAYLYWGRI